MDNVYPCCKAIFFNFSTTGWPILDASLGAFSPQKTFGFSSPKTYFAEVTIQSFASFVELADGDNELKPAHGHTVFITSTE